MLLALNTDRYCEAVFVLAVVLGSVLVLEPWLATLAVRGEGRLPAVLLRLGRRSIEARRAPAPAAAEPVDAVAWWRRPLLVVAVLSTVVAGVELWWIWRYRTFGTLNADEARYVAGSISFRQDLTGTAHPTLYLWFGPVIPIVSAVAMLVGPIDPRTAMSVQPVLAVLLAVATAGVARRVASDAAAVVAGLAVMLLPATIAAVQTYLLGIGAATAIMVALWALLASEGGRGRSIWLVGPLLCLAPLARGQTLVFLPALFLAVAVACRGSWSGLRRALTSVAFATAAMAACFRVWTPAILSYLYGGGFQDSQGTFDAERLAIRWRGLYDGVGHQVLWGAAAVAAAAFVVHVRSRRGAGETPAPGVRARPSPWPLVVVFAGGMATLLLSWNQGRYGFFDLPLLPVAVVLVVTAGARAPRPVRRVGGAWALAWLLAIAVSALWLVEPGDSPLDFARGEYRTAVVSASNPLDARFSPTQARSDLRRAAAEWWDFTLALETRLDRIRRRDGRELESFDGGRVVNFNAYLVDVATAKRNHQTLWFVGGDLTSIPEQDWGRLLEPDEHTWRRVLLIPAIDGQGSSYRGDRRSAWERQRLRDNPQVAAQAAFGEFALRRGWRVEARLPMPLGDEMLVIVDPRDARPS